MTSIRFGSFNHLLPFIVLQQMMDRGATEEEMRSYAASVCECSECVAKREAAKKAGEELTASVAATSAATASPPPFVNPFERIEEAVLTPTTLDPNLELRRQYLADCELYSEPWTFWEFKPRSVLTDWFDCTAEPYFSSKGVLFRRKAELKPEVTPIAKPEPDLPGRKIIKIGEHIVTAPLTADEIDWTKKTQFGLDLSNIWIGSTPGYFEIDTRYLDKSDAYIRFGLVFNNANDAKLAAIAVRELVIKTLTQTPSTGTL